VCGELRYHGGCIDAIELCLLEIICVAVRKLQLFCRSIYICDLDLSVVLPIVTQAADGVRSKCGDG
jgi:hypothetical protein